MDYQVNKCFQMMFIIFLLMYIDDIFIFSDNVLDLQGWINILETYCNDWGLQVNTPETEIIVFTNSGKIKRSDILNFG